jgi:hypothetical protein
MTYSDTSSGQKKNRWWIAIVAAVVLYWLFKSGILSALLDPNHEFMHINYSFLDYATMTLENNNSYGWRNTELTVNGEFRFNAGDFAPSEQKIISLTRFVNSRGEYYDPVRIRPLKISLSCENQRSGHDEFVTLDEDEMRKAYRY